MGKKDKNKKKGKGAEKTAAKTEKKQTQKRKKELAAIGEDDIEKIVAEIEKEEKRKSQVVEKVVDPPSRRVNFSFVPHPLKDELVLFGGEYFNGQKTFLYNDLFFYKLSRNEWMITKAPAGPPPRCGHQMVALPTNQGQLWIFGGEYASPTQEQFYHYRDLWVFHIQDKKWEKINAPGGPSARSGHRMVCVKKQLIVFGGFHDVLRDYKYFNDVYAFNLEDYTWKKLEPTGSAPSPRSGCTMVALADGRILMYGGYSKTHLKKDVDKGVVHTDMFLLAPDKHDTSESKWRWQQVKAAGVTVPPRCGLTLAAGPAGRAYVFGGVLDTEEDEEDIAGTFYNDLYVLELEKQCWRTVQISGKKDKDGKIRRRRRKDKDSPEGEEEGSASDQESEETPMEESTPAVIEDGVFTMTLGPGASSQATGAVQTEAQSLVFAPSPRMNCGLAVKNGCLFLYGGLMEDGDKQYTYSDFYSLDIHKLDEWKTIIPNDQSTQEWFDSSSSSDSESENESDSDEAMDEDNVQEEEEEMDQTNETEKSNTAGGVSA